MAVVAVIGAAGRMGSWFTNFLTKNRYKVIVCDKDTKAANKLARKTGCKFVEDEITAARLGEIVLLATPTPTTKNLLKLFKTNIPQTTLRIEISSSKQPLRETLKDMAKRKIPILSIHPMFGHGTRNPIGRTILVAQHPARNRLAETFLATLEKEGARIIQTDLDNHDRYVATTLALPHFLNFAMVNTLSRIGIEPSKAREIGGTTFRLQMLIAESLYHERLTNEVSIITDNPYAGKLLDRFAVEMNSFLANVKRHRRARLLRDLKNGANYVRKDAMFSSAYDCFNLAVEASEIN
ncbi:MAG TPA: prephenate dehydrogenase [Terriglobales bacterium]|nr:prephenate dehydrogenase [Terriglobales bacterium]